MLVGEQVLRGKDEGRAGAEPGAQLRQVRRVGRGAHRAVDQRHQAAADSSTAEPDRQPRLNHRMVTRPRTERAASPPGDRAPDTTKPDRGLAAEQRPGSISIASGEASMTDFASW